MKKIPKLMWRLLLFVVLGIILFATLRQDGHGLTAYNHIEDILTRNDWVGWIHPIGLEVGRTINVGPFDSLAECEDYSWSYLEQHYEGWEKAEYYCGYSCSDTNPGQREANCKLVR